MADTQTSIYKSVDGGATWQPVAGQPNQGFLPHHGTLGSNGMLYVTYNSAIGPYDAGTGAVLCTKPAGVTGRVGCTFSGTRFAPGPHPVFVRYTGDATHALAGTTVTYVVDRVTPSITAADRTGRYDVDGKVAVTGLQGRATGTVTFTAATAGSAGTSTGVTLCTAGVRDAAARCRYARKALDPGTYQVQAAYGGDAMFAARTVTFTLTVARGVTTMAASVVGAPWVAPGTAVHLAATGLPGGAGGTVTFTRKGVTLCTATVRKGAATCDTPTTLPVGHYVVTATYGGDARWQGASAQTIFDVSTLPA